jgi:uncharacterized protein involved in exopolysaccharide biosynthesis
MNFTLFLAALGARWRLFLLIVGLTVTAATVVSFLLPKTYVATAALLIDARDEQSLGGRAALSERERLGYLQTQVDILTGTQVARLVASRLALADDAKTRALFAKETGGVGDIEDWLGQALLQQVKVDTSQSSVVRLTYSDESAAFAARAANAFAQAFIDITLKLRTEPARQASLWFDDQVAGLRQNLVLAQRRLAEFQQEKGIITTDERYDLESARMVELANQAARTQGRSEDAIGGSLMRAEARLRELSVEYGERHPQYLQQKALVDALREKMISTPRFRENSAGSRSNLMETLEAQRERLLKLKVARGELAMLSHDVDIAQRSYEAAMQRLMTTRLESRANQSSVSLLEPATVPAKPFRPRIALNIALALVAGLGLGFSVVYLLELFDQRVRRGSDLASDPDIPLLAVLSHWESARPAALTAPGGGNPYRLPDIR